MGEPAYNPLPFHLEPLDDSDAPGAAVHTHDAADIVSGTLATVLLGSGTADATTFLRGDQTWAVPAASGAPVGGQYLVLATDATLTAERVLTGTADQVILTDAGAGSTLTLSLPQSIATTSTPQFARLGLGVAADAAITMLNAGASVVSAPAHKMTGAWFTGGTATTTKPHFLIEPTGTTSTAWSTAGTGLGVNAASGFTGNFIDLQLNGVSVLKLSSNGTLTVPFSVTTTFLSASGNIVGLADASALVLGLAADVFLRRDAANTFAQRNGTAAQRLRVYNTFTTVETSGEWFTIDWAATANVCNLWTKKGSGAGTARDLGLGTDGTQRWSIHATTGLLAAAAGVELQLGNAAAAGAVVPTHTVTLRDSTGTLYRVPCLV